jgi:hypothetical protein
MKLLFDRLEKVVDDFYDGIQKENNGRCPECDCSRESCNCNNISR